MLNRIVLMGRLTRDPELRRTQSGTAVVSFSVACDRDYAAQGAERETDFIDIVAWRGTAEFVDTRNSITGSAPRRQTRSSIYGLKCSRMSPSWSLPLQ